MRADGIASISPRRWRPVTTLPGHVAHTLPDRIQRRFDQGALNVVWTSDITYLATGEGWLYLRAVRDANTAGVIFHTDHAYQCTSTQLTDVTEELAVLLSVGRTGVCWDSTQHESFWSTLKTEWSAMRFVESDEKQI